MTKSNTIAAALVAITLAIAANSGAAQASPGIDMGLDAGTLMGIAAPKSKAEPRYVVAPGYDECRFVERTDRKGSVRTIKICEVVRN